MSTTDFELLNALSAFDLLATSHCLKPNTSEKTPQKPETPDFLRLTPYGSMAYEIQIRALRGPSPRMVLRMPKTQALPAGWQHLQRVEPFPASAK